jgi:ligand-binding SRPBCC domain-containing protein
MAEYIIEKSLTVERPIDEVFEFFANAHNLERITPPELNFHILTPQPITIEKGTLIDYQLRLYGIPIKWRTEITTWDPPNILVDTQLSGPYSQWIHTHRFTAVTPCETLIEDRVRYRLPLEPLGDIAHFIVRRQLEYIFDFREKEVGQILREGQMDQSPQ